VHDTEISLPRSQQNNKIVVKNNNAFIHSPALDIEFIDKHFLKATNNQQSLSEVVGTHAVLACKWIITVFYTQYRSPTPNPINVV
jgi:hypothetical protein